MTPRLQFLRPYASQSLATATPAQCSAYLRFYELAQAQTGRSVKRRARQYATAPKGMEELSPAQASAFRTRRIAELKDAGQLEYPRLSMKGRPASTRQFRTEFTEADATALKGPQMYCIHGRVTYVSKLGPRFSFVKIINDGVPLQVMVNHLKLKDDTTQEMFKEFHRVLQRGDHISVSGQPAHSKTGELSILARELPKIVAPCLIPLPHKLSPETAVQNRHMDYLTRRSAREILIMRDLIIKHLRAYLSKSLKCVEVQTPILAANAGGATARPFMTQASEFSQKELALRIAPELWLKRLVVAGLDKVYELGPSFRNEGIDATHNPEFTTCEFYIAHINLNSLLNITQTLFYGLAKSISKHQHEIFPSLDLPPVGTFDSQFAVVEFIPAIEEALGQSLPDLESETAVPDLIKLLNEAGKDWHRSLPPNPSLPKLLDHIAAAVIEPRSADQPLFIIYHPLCMSPLAKTLVCPKTGQQVAARAELFYGGNELANMYEEENDPFKQRAKFVAQAKARLALLRGGEVAFEDAPAHHIDEQYISVLESGLPPTGGWGCGVDRLVMLFSGAKRISDVQPFGNLRHVVGLAATGASRHQQRGGAEAAERDPARELVTQTRLAAAKATDRAKRRGKKTIAAKGDLSETHVDDEMREVLMRSRARSTTIEGTD